MKEGRTLGGEEARELGVGRVMVAHCVHCDRLTICPLTDQCSCGEELYPCMKTIKLGVATSCDDMKGW